MVYFYHILHIFHNHWHAKPPCFDRNWFAEQLSSLLRSVSETPNKFEPYGIFESNFSDLFILVLFSHPGMQNDGEGLPSIILAGQGLLNSENAHNS